jgi:bZIP-type transcription factor MBZ1
MMKPTHPTPSSSATAASSSHAQCYDPLDLFTNVEDLYPSPSLSPPSSSRSSAPSFQAPATANPNNTLLPPDQSFGSNFSGPSHQYERYKQQTGIPADVFAQTLAVNPASKMYNQIQYGFSDPFDPTDLKGEDDLFDFNTTSAQFSGASDMDMEYDTPPADSAQPAFFFPEQSSSVSSECINPSAIEEESDNLSTSKIGQLYPGMHQQMHQQQAALAKAQAEQQKQQALQLPKQRQRPVVTPHASKKPNRTQKMGAQQPTDPMIEDRISRLLSSMRQSSIATSDEDTSGRDGLLPHISRMKKEEEDMDEDERLLASEEGKKLSSKERRQLRNKVSARAFRSRRKGKVCGQSILEEKLLTQL